MAVAERMHFVQARQIVEQTQVVNPVVLRCKGQGRALRDPLVSHDSKRLELTLRETGDKDLTKGAGAPRPRPVSAPEPVSQCSQPEVIDLGPIGFVQFVPARPRPKLMPRRRTVALDLTGEAEESRPDVVAVLEWQPERRSPCRQPAADLDPSLCTVP